MLRSPIVRTATVVLVSAAERKLRTALVGAVTESGVPSRIMAHVSSQVYDAISESYRDSKWLLFRHFVERYTVMELLGDLHDQTVLDMACGRGSLRSPVEAGRRRRRNRR